MVFKPDERRSPEDRVVHENQQQELGDVIEVIDVSGYKPCRIPQ